MSCQSHIHFTTRFAESLYRIWLTIFFISFGVQSSLFSKARRVCEHILHVTERSRTTWPDLCSKLFAMSILLILLLFHPLGTSSSLGASAITKPEGLTRPRPPEANHHLGTFFPGIISPRAAME
ncbi:hypothetical protein F5Y16DRAFT_47151 [Xylariaceae sp. FL0255]|nr:hypothetical protein F5Y16DRAFT_47151 [Xylariaceae sp. FL0255]